MTGAAERQLLIDRFGPQYRDSQSAVIRELRRLTLGDEFAGTSWTTKIEALEIANHLALAPGVRLLEVGAGAGWPGLFFSRQTDCEALLLDLPLDGLRAALGRSEADQILDRCRFLVASGAHLPLKGPQFDAIHHADVLCCLSDKTGVLQACRDVIRPGGTMAFTVLHLSPGLTRAEREEAAEYGPPFVTSDATYEEMLSQADWEIIQQEDLTEKYGDTLRLTLTQETRLRDGLIELQGEPAFEERVDRRRRSIVGVDRGLIGRALFVVKPV